jgi:hypothetical protein
MAKREYLDAMRRRYRQATGRKEKTEILDEICATTEYDRKYVLRFLSKGRKRGRPSTGRQRGRWRQYGPEVLGPLKKIWLTANLPCSKRLKAMIPHWLPSYESLFGQLADDVREKLVRISPATIDRLLQQPRQAHVIRGRCTTKPGGLLRAQIPIQTGQWQQERPGHLEGDTVAHCGSSGAGEFAFTLSCVDVATGWTEQRALWCKGADGVVRQMRSIEKALPFPLLGFDTDNGSEFINEQLVKHFLGRQTPVLFTRSRAYHKNDNAHIEQKNWTHVRQWIGYDRMDTREAVDALNELYTNEWRLFHNFYCASVRLTSKAREGSTLVKKYDAPKTPYQRVLDSPSRPVPQGPATGDLRPHQPLHPSEGNRHTPQEACEGRAPTSYNP